MNPTCDSFQAPPPRRRRAVAWSRVVFVGVLLAGCATELPAVTGTVRTAALPGSLKTGTNAGTTGLIGPKGDKGDQGANGPLGLRRRPRSRTAAPPRI